MNDDIQLAINLIPGCYVACVYDKECYLANVVEVPEENRDVLLKFMKKCKIVSHGPKNMTSVRYLSITFYVRLVLWRPKVMELDRSWSLILQNFNSRF